MHIHRNIITIALAIAMLASVLGAPLAAADGGVETPDDYLGNNSDPVVSTTQSDATDPANGTSETLQEVLSHESFPDMDPVYDAPTNDDYPVSIDQIAAGSDANHLAFEIQYEGDMQDPSDINTAIFLDVDQDRSTGLNSDTEGWYYMPSDMGADYMAVVGQDAGPQNQDAYLARWDDEADGWSSETSIDQVEIDTASNTMRVAIDRSKIENPDAVNFAVGNGGPGQEWAPPQGQGSLSFDLTDDGDSDDAPSGVEYVETNISNTELTPGETAEISVQFAAQSESQTALLIRANSQRDLGLELEDASPPPQLVDGNTNERVTVWPGSGSTVEYTVTYTVTVPEDATEGSLGTIAGLLYVDGTEVPVLGEEISVVEPDHGDGGDAGPAPTPSIQNIEQEFSTTEVAPGETTEVTVRFDAQSEDQVVLEGFVESTFNPEIDIVETTPSTVDQNIGDYTAAAAWPPTETQTQHEITYAITVPEDATEADYLGTGGVIRTGSGEVSEQIPFRELSIGQSDDGGDGGDGGDGDDGSDGGDGGDGSDDGQLPDNIPEGEAVATLQPADKQAVGDSEVTYDIVLAGLDNGMSSYDLTVNVSDPAVAAITDARVEREAGFGDETITADGSSVKFERALGDEPYEPAEEIVLGQVTLTTAETVNETATITVGQSSVNDIDSTAYVLSTQSATLEVVDEPPAPDVTGNGNPATDTTGDGKLNDIDGDGEFGISDVQVFFENRDSAAIQNNPELFDFTNSGDVGIADVQALFEQV